MSIKYEIRPREHPDERQEEWLEGFSMMLHPDGEKTLIGRVADQATLYGLLLRIRDLGIPLLSVNGRSDRHEETEG
jgi:hypothetical protein